MKKILTLIFAALLLTACSQKKEKILVLYYSQSNTTKALAEEIQLQLQCDIDEIECTNPYTGDFNSVLTRWQNELQSGKKPELNPLNKNISDYDVIFLGYPVWGGTYALPIASLLEKTDFAGKKLVPFCTFGSGGLNTSSAELKKNAKNAQILNGYGIRQARISNAKEEVSKFLIKAGFKQGEAEVLPEFSAQKEVTDEEKEIFHKACDGYQFPLGNPITVGSRATKKGTEYLFTVEVQDGKTAQIFVIKKDNSKAEFTEVVR